jgi:hypothetical protein
MIDLTSALEFALWIKNTAADFGIYWLSGYLTNINNNMWHKLNPVNDVTFQMDLTNKYSLLAGGLSPKAARGLMDPVSPCSLMFSGLAESANPVGFQRYVLIYYEYILNHYLCL